MIGRHRRSADRTPPGDPGNDLLTRLRQVPGRFHRDRGGQITFLTLFGAVALAGLLGLVMTTGHQTDLKIETQNAADAAALSGGAWIARGLNLTSAANVAQSQLVSGAILLQALDDTLRWSIPIVQLQIAAYTACTPFFPPCGIAAKLLTVQLKVLRVASKAVKKLAKWLAECPGGLFWRIARGLETLNSAVHRTFLGIAVAEGLLVGRANGAEVAALIPGDMFYGEIPSFPTEEATFQDLCAPMTEGSPTPDRRGYGQLLGYPQDQGPYRLGRCRLTWVTAGLTGLPPAGLFLMPALAEMHKAKYCGGPGASLRRPLRRPAGDLDECRRLGGEATWRRVVIRTPAIGSGDGCGWLARRSENDPASGMSSGSRRSVERPCGDPPPGRRLGPSLYCRSLGRERAGEDRWRHELETWTLEGAWIDDPAAVPPASGACSSGKPKPYLLRRDPGALRYLVVAYRPNRSILFTESFLERPPPLVTYAQVEIYNGLSEDAFTQDWRVRLERASLLERPFAAADGSPAGVALSRLFSRAGVGRFRLADLIDRINNH